MRLQQTRTGPEKQIRNCTDAIADGKRHPSLMEKLSELEQELADTKAKIASCEPREVRLRLKGARRFADAHVLECCGHIFSVQKSFNRILDNVKAEYKQAKQKRLINRGK